MKPTHHTKEILMADTTSNEIPVPCPYCGEVFTATVSTGVPTNGDLPLTLTTPPEFSSHVQAHATLRTGIQHRLETLTDSLGIPPEHVDPAVMSSALAELETTLSDRVVTGRAEERERVAKKLDLVHPAVAALIRAMS